MRCMITCPTRAMTPKVASHRSAHGLVLAEMLREAGNDVVVNWKGHITDHDQFDRIYMYHGNDFDGQLNLYGGVEAWPYIENTANFFKYRGEVVSLEIDCPDYHQYFKTRIETAKAKGKKILPGFAEMDMSNVRRISKTATTLKVPFLGKGLVIGDSHTTALYRSGFTCVPIKYKTLYGALMIGLENLVAQTIADHRPRTIEFYFGNIDVRHHLCRRPDPLEAACDLAGAYAAQALLVAKKYDADVRLYELLPIEDEARNVPKRGWYEGTPFYGSRKMRDAVRMAFRDQLMRLSVSLGGFRLIEWTKGLEDDEGKLRFECMEKPRSIHLSRQYYPYWNGEMFEQTGSGGDDPNPTPEKLVTSATLDAFFV